MICLLDVPAPTLIDQGASHLILYSLVAVVVIAIVVLVLKNKRK